MSLRTLDILTSFNPPRKVVMLGNEAVARGAIEAGVRGAFAYPGTPSTEISEMLRRVSSFQRNPRNARSHPDLTADPIHFEYSVNEKVALEKAIAFTLGNRSAICCMKSAGLNVASDPLLTILYQVIGRGLVVVVCDDPGCFSSTTEQDSRHYGPLASVPVFNPATPDETCRMTKEAFALSDRLKLPILVRLTTRVSHARGVVRFGEIAELSQIPKFEKSPRHLNIPSRTAAAHRSLLAKLESDEVQNVLRCYTEVKHTTSSGGNKLTVIADGAAYNYLTEVLHRRRLDGLAGLIKIGVSHPFPTDMVAEFLKTGCRRALVLEELDPIIEDQVRLAVQKNRLDVEVVGKGFAALSRVGEYNLGIVGEAIGKFFDRKIERRRGLPRGNAEFLKEIPQRPPVLCPGCPHRATFYALKMAAYQNAADLVLCGDIGCFAMGALPPFQLMDTIHHMGMSLSMAQGLSQAFEAPGGKRKMVALVGDGTFFHSGILSLLNAVYTCANVTVVIFDNRTIGMTGQQPHPGSAAGDASDSIDLTGLLKAMGVGFVESFDPNDVAHCYHSLKRALDYEGVAVVVAKSPCVFLAEFKERVLGAGRIEVDPSRCNACGNQRDEALFCSRFCTPDDLLAKARAKLTAERMIAVGRQACPANICNHGFFSAIVAGDYRGALNIVRDKTLFTRVCGEICPRPCEFLFTDDGKSTVPIRQLKLFIASLEQNFGDFSVQKDRAKRAKKIGRHIAVVGAGPAGLSAAYDLIQAGYDVTVFEKESAPGGLLNTVIPAFRIDKRGYRQEIDMLEGLGVSFKYNTNLGGEIELSQLTEDFDAVVLAVGMAKSMTLDAVDGALPAEKRFDALTFLQKFNRSELALRPGSTILVVGGGNSAIDAARAAKRCGSNVVSIIYRRTRQEMPAFEEEIKTALAEGVEIVPECVITSCTLTTDGRIEVELKGFGDGADRGRIRCDYIVTAIGQKGDRRVINNSQFRTNSSGRIIADEETGYSGYKNVFVAGDICAGNHASLIGAIASGKRAAVGVRGILERYPHPFEGIDALRILNANPRAKMGINLEEVDVLRGFNPAQSTQGFYLVQTCAKCNHCIDNFGCPALIRSGGKVIIDQNQCNRCGQCIDVCVNDAIHWVETEATLQQAENILMQE